MFQQGKRETKSLLDFYTQKRKFSCVPYTPVVLNLFYISYPLLLNKIVRFTPNTLNDAYFLKI